MGFKAAVGQEGELQDGARRVDQLKRTGMYLAQDARQQRMRRHAEGTACHADLGRYIHRSRSSRLP